VFAGHDRVRLTTADPLKIQIITTLSTQAMKNITVYHGIAFSAVYGPKAPSASAPELAKEPVPFRFGVLQLKP
jgi:hypothetical protein